MCGFISLPGHPPRWMSVFTKTYQRKSRIEKHRNTTWPTDPPPVDENHHPIFSLYGTFLHIHPPKRHAHLPAPQDHTNAAAAARPGCPPNYSPVSEELPGFFLPGHSRMGFRKTGHRSARLGEKAVGVGWENDSRKRELGPVMVGVTGRTPGRHFIQDRETTQVMNGHAR